MAYKLGTHDLYLTKIEYTYGEINMVEKQVIPDPSTWDGTSNSVLLGLGKKLDIISVEGYADKTNIQYLATAEKTYSKETFTYNTDTLNVYVTKLKYELKFGSPYYYYSLEFIVL